MVRVSLLVIIFLNTFFLAIGYVSGKPNYKSLQLSDSAEDMTIALIIGVKEDSERSTRSQSEEENNDDAIEILQLLLKTRNYELSRNQNHKSVELSDISIESKSRAALRAGCYKSQQCQDKCKKKKSCKKMCVMIYDSSNQCETTTTTRDPCAKKGDPCAKWGKTMPPKWRLLLRAIQQQDE